MTNPTAYPIDLYKHCVQICVNIVTATIPMTTHLRMKIRLQLEPMDLPRLPTKKLHDNIRSIKKLKLYLVTLILL